MFYFSDLEGTQESNVIFKGFRGGSSLCLQRLTLALPFLKRIITCLICLTCPTISSVSSTQYNMLSLELQSDQLSLLEGSDELVLGFNIFKKKQHRVSEVQLVGPLCLSSLLKLFQLKPKYCLHFLEFSILHNRCSRGKFCRCSFFFFFKVGYGLHLLKSLNGDQRENKEEQEIIESDLAPRPSHPQVPETHSSWLRIDVQQLWVSSAESSQSLANTGSNT